LIRSQSGASGSRSWRLNRSMARITQSPCGQFCSSTTTVAWVI
jgi:hypothetical protein